MSPIFSRLSLLLAFSLVLTASDPARPQFTAERGAMVLRGFIQPSRDVKVGLGEPGLLDEVHVKRGSHVLRGALLGALDSRVERVQFEVAKARAEATGAVDRARASLELARLRLEDTRELVAKDVLAADQLAERGTEEALARATLAEAQNDRTIAALQRDLAAQRLARREVRSPVDGVVVDVFHEPGEHVDAVRDAPLVRIAVLDPLRAEFLFSVESLGQVSVGDEVELVLPNVPSVGRVVGRVEVIDPVIDAASQTYRVRVEIPNSEGRVPAGVECELHVGA